MKKGFTLVELAIVLVIIGLLIGGILVAQSMMDTARIHRQIQQFQQFDVAVSNYKLNYNYLPGDSNHNGYIEDDYHACPVDSSAPLSAHTCGYYGSDTLNFFPNLSTTGHLTDRYAYNVHASTGIGKPLPKAAIGLGGIATISGYYKEVFYMLGAIRDDNGTSTYTTTFYNLFYMTDSPSANSQRGILTPSQALAIDTKLDDGLPGTGIVRAFYWNVPGSATDYGRPPYGLDIGGVGGGRCTSSSKYLPTSSSDPNCLISVVSGVDGN